MSQLDNVSKLMGDGEWRTPFEIALALSTSDGRMSESSAASRLRDLKAEGKHVEKQSAGGHNYKYRIAPAVRSTETIVTMDAPEAAAHDGPVELTAEGFKPL